MFHLYITTLYIIYNIKYALFIIVNKFQQPWHRHNNIIIMPMNYGHYSLGVGFFIEV